MTGKSRSKGAGIEGEHDRSKTRFEVGSRGWRKARQKDNGGGTGKYVWNNSLRPSLLAGRGTLTVSICGMIHGYKAVSGPSDQEECLEDVWRQLSSK